MNLFDVASVLVAAAAACGYLNHRFLKLPASSGTLVLALASSLAVLVVDVAFPSLRLPQTLDRFLSQIDFNDALMHGMLCFLLFAGAMSVDLDELLAQKWRIAALATGSVLISTAITGALMWGVFRLIGADVPLAVCFVFGALISPTDPVAVMGLLKEMRAPKSLEAQIGGESLFNDGIGVVVFLGLVAVAGLGGPSALHEIPGDPLGVTWFLLRQVIGGGALGLGMGFVAYAALKSIDHHPLELLITLALVMLTYAVSFWIPVSGPIAVVMAGLLIGSRGRQFAMTSNTRAHVDAFWNMIDELLNAVLFLLIGLQVLSVPVSSQTMLASVLSIPIVLVARFVSVGVPVLTTGRRGMTRGLVPVLTWAGLRGGLSVAMMLSLPPFPSRELLLACTYATVVFSILGQGLTVRRLLMFYGIRAGR